MPMPPRSIRTPRALLAALLVLAAVPHAAAQRGPLRGLDAYVEQARVDWHVPGLAVAVVKDDSVVYLRGFGTRTVGRDEPVDAHTSFAIASTTKAFTATALAMLVDEGKVRWDDPVSLHVPGFQPADPSLSGELTVRDLLTHRSGLPATDQLWYATAASRDEILRRLRFVRPEARPRTTYQYNNTAYVVAGMVVQGASGMSWEDFVRTRILEPLEMRETLTGFPGLETRGNVATPHVEVRDTVRPIRYRNMDNAGPAGSINSSIADMVKWIRFQLAGGVAADGRRLVSEAQHREMLRPQFVIPPSQYYPAARLAAPNFTAYGLGWFMQDYRGRKLAMHTGSIDGMTAILALVPEERLGLVIYANLDHAELRHALMYRIIDAYLGGEPRDWSREMHALYAPFAEQAREAERAALAKRVEGTRPSLPLEGYAGSYADPDSLWDPFTVRVEEGRMTAVLGGDLAGRAEHWHYDVFRVRWDDIALGESFLTFTIDREGRAAWVRVDGTLLNRVPEPPGEAGS
jgi:CubicO group peptidase (beta-lactamase class C family)